MAPAEVARRALAWRRDDIARVCDVIEPWEHGIVARATRYPDYYDYNLVVVEGDPGIDVEALEASADEALAGLDHRRVDFEDAEAGEALRDQLTARGWRSMRLVWMRHEHEPPPGAEVPVEVVPYDAVNDLRSAWYREDFPDQDPGEYHAQAREVAHSRDVRVLAVRDDSNRPIAYAQVERCGDAAEVTQVYVGADHRGGGRGTAMTTAAILAAGDVPDLWIAADDEDRPKELYARLGFAPAVRTMEFTRWPRS